VRNYLYGTFYELCTDGGLLNRGTISGYTIKTDEGHVATGTGKTQTGICSAARCKAMYRQHHHTPHRGLC